MAQLLMQGTKFVNFVGYNAWVGGAGGVSAVQVTEWDEPQAVIGSYLHQYAYPDWFTEHQERGQKLQNAQEHGAGDRELPAVAWRISVRGRRRERHAGLRRREHRRTRAFPRD